MDGRTQTTNNLFNQIILIILGSLNKNNLFLRPKLILRILPTIIVFKIRINNIKEIAILQTINKISKRRFKRLIIMQLQLTKNKNFLQINLSHNSQILIIKAKIIMKSQSKEIKIRNKLRKISNYQTLKWPY